MLVITNMIDICFFNLYIFGMNSKKFLVKGMSCAACQSRIEKVVGNLEGVDACSVSLLTNTMLTEGTADEGAIIQAVENAGYSAKLLDEDSENKTFDALKDESKLLLKRFSISLFLLCFLFYINMGMMYGWPLPSFLKNHYLNASVQCVLSLIILIINKKFFTSGIKSLLHLSPNMDTLVALGSSVSFIYSFISLILRKNNPLFFESAAMIVTLITIGKCLEAFSKGKTTDALKNLIKLSPETAVILKDGKEIEVPASQIKRDDIFIVRPGVMVAVDGVVIDGSSAVNEASLTGESWPCEKSPGDKVYAATVNTNGYLKCRATQVANQTVFSQIVQLVKDAASTKAPIAKIADKVSAVFIPSVIIISISVFLIWFLTGHPLSFSITKAVSVLVVSCPCALGLATPVAVMVGNGVAFKNGILFKTSQSLENLGKIKVFGFDKTGTITKGECAVMKIEAENKLDALQFALNIESKSEHPLARAIVREGEKKNLKPQSVDDFKIESGRGISAKKNGELLFGGNINYLKNNCPDLFVFSKHGNYIQKTVDDFSNEGCTAVIFASKKNNQSVLHGIFVIADEIREESGECIRVLNQLDVETILLSGDNQKTADAVAEKTGIKKVFAGLLPFDKEKIIRQLQNDDKKLTAMIGDGINDAPSLTAADIGIAVGNGTDVAIDCADVVLVKPELLKICFAVKLSRAVLKNIKQNLFWAFFYNIILIPIAAGVFHFMNIDLNPVIAAGAMSLSSFCVVMNALRLNLFKDKIKPAPNNLKR